MASPTPGDVVDDDTLQAVQALWRQAGLPLPALVTQKPRWGRGKSPDPIPYAQVECELTNRQAAGTAAAGSPIPWYDHRKVTIKVWALKDDLVTIQGLLTAIFNALTVLIYPSGARFMRWWPEGGGILKQDPATKDGRDIWISEQVADVWSVRLQ